MHGEVSASVAPPESLARGREALRRHAWQEAYDELARADQARPLEANDLEALADAAFFAARGDEDVAIRERAFKAHLAAGNTTRAAFLALLLAREIAAQGKTSISAAWARRAEHLLEGQPESYAHGYLALSRSEMARRAGDLNAAVAQAIHGVEIGERMGDDELRAWGRATLGTLRIAAGAAPDGLALLEEAAIAAVSGELSAIASGVICCTMIATCRNLTDYQRASEWIEATDRYCESQSVSGFPGACRIHRAEIVAIGGAWERAASELERATAELARFNVPPLVADGYYALGEVRRLAGDLSGAEEALRQAHALGRSPQPALALIRLAEGKAQAAATALGTALRESATAPWPRSLLLAAQVEVSLAIGDQAKARAAADELGAMVTTFPTPALDASARMAIGRVLLAENDAQSAVVELRTAIQRWQEVGSPYEIARTRRLLSEGLRKLGDEEDAELEVQAARTEFERLGATLDLAALDRTERAMQERRGRPHQVVRTFMFTDIVGSTKLADVLGDEAWERLLQWHDATLREVIARHGGDVVNSTGDGFFGAFAEAPPAVESAIAIQRELDAHRRATGFALDVRIGLHTARVNQRGTDYSGAGVHIAARVAALAGAGQIFVTREVLANAPDVPRGDLREVQLKGIAAPTSVADVRWD
jgi:class 3 adenylate cyclase